RQRSCAPIFGSRKESQETQNRCLLQVASPLPLWRSGQAIRWPLPFCYSSRCHMYSKDVARVMKCFKNPAKTIHDRNQMSRALYEKSIDFTKKNFWSGILNDKVNGIILSYLPGVTTHDTKVTKKSYVELDS